MRFKDIFTQTQRYFEKNTNRIQLTIVGKYGVFLDFFRLNAIVNVPSIKTTDMRNTSLEGTCSPQKFPTAVPFISSQSATFSSSQSWEVSPMRHSHSYVLL